MRYFEHDSSALEDEKMALLFIEFGYEGIGLYWSILEKLTKQEKPINTLVLKHQLKVGKKLAKCWKFMESIDIISSNNGETFSKRLTNFIESYQEKKYKTSKRVLQHRENQTHEENVTRYNHESNATDKIRIDKIRIEENIIPPNPLKGETDSTKKNDLIENEKTETKKTPRRGKFEPDLSKLDENSSQLILKFIEFRKRKRRSFTCQDEVDLFIETLRDYSDGSFKVAKEIIENSIRAGYPDIYRPKNFTNGKSKQSHEQRVEKSIETGNIAIQYVEREAARKAESERRRSESSSNQA